MSERLGIGILCFYKADEVARAVASVKKHCKADYRILIWDNSENDEVGEWARHHAGDVAYARAPYNVGCSRGRNGIAKWFLQRGVSHFVVQDQDVEWVGDAGSAMRAVFARHPDTGIASWRLANKQMSGKSKHYTPDETGVVTEIPGMCCMYSAACIGAMLRQASADGCEDCRPWNTRMLMYRFDSLFALLAGKAGYKTRVVWPDADLVRHNHPHKGVQRHPRWRAEQARSRGIYAAELKKHGLTSPV